MIPHMSLPRMSNVVLQRRGSDVCDLGQSKEQELRDALNRRSTRIEAIVARPTDGNCRFRGHRHHRLELCQDRCNTAVPWPSDKSLPAQLQNRPPNCWRSKNDLPGRGMSECRNVVVGRRKMGTDTAMICSCRVLRADMKARGIPRVFWAASGLL